MLSLLISFWKDIKVSYAKQIKTLFLYLPISSSLSTCKSVDPLLHDRRQWFKFLHWLGYYKLRENWQLEGKDPNMHLWCKGRQKFSYWLWLESAKCPCKHVSSTLASNSTWFWWMSWDDGKPGLTFLEELGDNIKICRQWGINNSTTHKITCFYFGYSCTW